MSELRKLSGEDLRRLNKSTVALMRALFVRRGPAGLEFEAELGWLANKAKLTLRTAERCLQRLREAGVVTTERAVANIQHNGGTIRRATANRYNVLGEYRVRRGVESFSIPSVGFDSWVADKKTQGRPRKDAHLFLPGSRKKVAGPTPNERQKKPPPFTEKAQHLAELSRKGGGSNIKKEKVFLKSPPKGGNSKKDSVQPKQDTANFQSRGVSKLHGRHPLQVRRQRRSCSREPVFDLRVLSAPRPSRSSPAEKIIPPRPDLPQREYVGHPYFEPSMTDRQLVTMLLHAFNAAHYEVFGERSYAYAQSGSVLRAKAFPRLLKAAKALLEKEVPPQSWAEWRMKYYDKTGKKCPPMHVIFAEKTIRTKSGWWRKDWDGVAYEQVITDLNREQMYRVREVNRINRGLPPLSFLPRWYVELRQDEISKGAEDPLQHYPRLRKSGGSRRDYISTVSRTTRR